MPTKKIPNASEIAASLGQPPVTQTPLYQRRNMPRLLEEERAEIIRSVCFTRPEIEFLNRLAGEQTTMSGRRVSISEILRQLVDEKMNSTL